MLYAMFCAYIYVSTCLYVQIYMLRVLCHVFLCFVPPFCSMLILGSCAHMLVTLCLDLCVYALFAMFHAQICIRTCLYAWIHVLPCLRAKFLHVYMYVSMPICLDLCFHMLVCLDLCSLHALCQLSMCSCALCHVHVPRPRLCLSCHVLLQPFCRFIFLSCDFGLMV